MSMKKINEQLQEKVMGESNAQATDFMYYSKLLQKPFADLDELRAAEAEVKKQEEEKDFGEQLSEFERRINEENMMKIDDLETMKKELSAEEYNNYTDKINNAILDSNVNESGEKTTLTEQQALMFASQLAMGNTGNIDSYTNILTNEKLSAEDKQAIINAFEKITGSSLLEDISAVYDNKYTENKMLQKWQLN